MGRHNCAWCQSPDLPDWEARLAAGESFTSVVKLTPFSQDVGLNHLNHMTVSQEATYDYYDL